eukprot:1735550-Prymnesium_polylepis.1
MRWLHCDREAQREKVFDTHTSLPRLRVNACVTGFFWVVCHKKQHGTSLGAPSRAHSSQAVCVREWDTRRGQTLRPEGLSGIACTRGTGMRSARALAAICISPPHGTPPEHPCCCNPSRTVHQLRAAE